MNRHALSTFTVIVINLFMWFGLASAQGNEKVSIPFTPKKLEIQRGLLKIEKECIECHAKEEPGKVNDWALGLHARSNVTCLDCHGAELTRCAARDHPVHVGKHEANQVAIRCTVELIVCCEWGDQRRKDASEPVRFLVGHFTSPRRRRCESRRWSRHRHSGAASGDPAPAGGR